MNAAAAAATADIPLFVHFPSNRSYFVALRSIYHPRVIRHSIQTQIDYSIIYMFRIQNTARCTCYNIQCINSLGSFCLRSEKKKYIYNKYAGFIEWIHVCLHEQKPNYDTFLLVERSIWRKKSTLNLYSSRQLTVDFGFGAHISRKLARSTSWIWSLTECLRQNSTRKIARTPSSPGLYERFAFFSVSPSNSHQNFMISRLWSPEFKVSRLN